VPFEAAQSCGEFHKACPLGLPVVDSLVAWLRKLKNFLERFLHVARMGKGLLGDAKLMFDWDRFSTALALSVLAQEEFAKAFLLQLVVDDALPWLPEVRRSMARHQCKHLLAVVMEWLPPFDADLLMEQIRRNSERHQQWMAWAERRSERYRQGNIRLDPDDPEPVEGDFYFPPDVAAALNIYRHEEIERLRSGEPRVDADGDTVKARMIADGSLDRKKQSGFYVDVTKTGEIGLHPGLITREEASEEIQRAERLSEGPITYSDEYQKLKETLRLIFRA
jgi:AbiV family abortive infection protein